MSVRDTKRMDWLDKNFVPSFGTIMPRPTPEQAALSPFKYTRTVRQAIDLAMSKPRKAKAEQPQ